MSAGRATPVPTILLHKMLNRKEARREKLRQETEKHTHTHTPPEHTGLYVIKKL